MGGYVTFVLAVFLIILGASVVNSEPNLFPNPSGSPASQSSAKYCEEVAGSGAPTFTAPSDNVTKKSCPNSVFSGDSSIDQTELDEEVKNRGNSKGSTRDRHEFGAVTTYKLIRKQVPIEIKIFDSGNPHADNVEDIRKEISLNNISGIDLTKFDLFYPEISGEIKMDREYPSRTRCRNSKLLYFVDYGMVFVLPKDREKVKGTDFGGAKNEFYLADVYQDINRPKIPEDAFKCSLINSGANQSDISVAVPSQQPSLENKEIQLGYFLLDKTNVNYGWNTVCKPAVYLYPKEKTLVNVKVYPKGFLTYTDPQYDINKGWSVWANPDGKLTELHDSRYTIHDYLYYESKIRDEVIKKPSEGFVVKFGELEKLYWEVLPKLGLNQIQVKDFVEYWTKALPYSNYYFVGIMDQQNVNQIEPLEITPNPDFVNRVRVYFERLDKPIEVEAPNLESRVKSLESSFKVVEWGGMVKNDKDHPFTCSQ